MQKRLRERLFMLALGLGALLCALAGRPGYAAQFTSATGNYSITYPDTWYADPHGRDVFLANYTGQQLYAAGHTTPPGGTSIAIQTFPPYDNPYYLQSQDDYAALKSVVGNETVVAQTTPSTGQPARVTTVANALNDRSVYTIVHKGGKVFFFILSCNADDPQAASYEQVLNDVIACISITGITPAAPTPTP